MLLVAVACGCFQVCYGLLKHMYVKRFEHRASAKQKDIVRGACIEYMLDPAAPTCELFKRRQVLY